MGYFPNGSTGMDYQATWCDRCVHSQDRESMCPILSLHYDWNYSSCGETPEAKTQRAALDHFIPQIGIENAGCLGFLAADDEWKGREDELRDLYKKNILRRKAKYEARMKGEPPPVEEPEPKGERLVFGKSEAPRGTVSGAAALRTGDARQGG
jgi:hypothetical protein